MIVIERRRSKEKQMPLKIRFEQFNNPTDRKVFADNSGKKLVKGNIVEVDSSLGKMNTAYLKLKKEGIAANLNNNITDNEFAIELLSAFNCSISTEAKSFSLLSTQTDVEQIQNENILDQKLYKNITNQKISASDKFSNTDSDPIYTLDDSVENSILAEARNSLVINEVDLSNLVAEVVQENFSSNGTTIKQFKK
tara:strand:- start:215 stop:799 length:585 start_codon:yes stop_codon:yes gene_type:complete